MALVCSDHFGSFDPRRGVNHSWHFCSMQGVLNGMLAVMNWFSDICSWKSPVTTVLVHILLLILVWHPELLLPTIFLYMFLIGAWNYRFRSRTPPFMDAKLSQGQHIGDLDELEEEFNVVPANRAQEVSLCNCVQKSLITLLVLWHFAVIAVIPWRKKVTAFLNEGTRAGTEAQVWEASRCGWSTSKCTWWTCHHRWTAPFSPQLARSQVWLPFPCQKGCLKAESLTNEIFFHLVITRIPTLFSSVSDTQHIWFLLVVCLTGLLQYS